MWLLMLGILTGGAVTGITTLPSDGFATREACEAVRSHPNVIGSYRDIYGENVVLWCAEAKKPQ